MVSNVGKSAAMSRQRRAEHNLGVHLHQHSPTDEVPGSHMGDRECPVDRKIGKKGNWVDLQ
ncbi:hypothetical protein AYI69_g8127, partial [Smittium culicis]